MQQQQQMMNSLATLLALLALIATVRSPNRSLNWLFGAVEVFLQLTKRKAVAFIFDDLIANCLFAQVRCCFKHHRLCYSQLASYTAILHKDLAGATDSLDS